MTALYALDPVHVAYSVFENEAAQRKQCSWSGTV